ncbi:MAG: hypothetical protein VW475_05490 [Curvibacter sp.]
MLKLGSILLLFGFIGMLSGFFSAFAYSFSSASDKTLLTVIGVFLGAPVIQGLIFMIYALLGYPIYRICVLRGWIPGVSIEGKKTEAAV